MSVGSTLPVTHGLERSGALHGIKMEMLLGEMLCKAPFFSMIRRFRRPAADIADQIQPRAFQHRGVPHLAYHGGEEGPCG